jgi:hypothetical protein
VRFVSGRHAKHRSGIGYRVRKLGMNAELIDPGSGIGHMQIGLGRGMSGTSIFKRGEWRMVLFGFGFVDLVVFCFVRRCGDGERKSWTRLSDREHRR